MHKMLRHMKKYAGMLAAIVALLVAQAMCELWLPTYTAAIVDVGIQQQGIEHSTPRAIRQSTLESLILWMPQEEAQSLVKPSYAVGTPEELAKQGIRFEDEPVWLLGKADDSRLEQLDALFDRAFLIHGVLNGQSELDAGMLMAASDAGEQAAGMTAGQIQSMVAAMDGEQRMGPAQGLGRAAAYRASGRNAQPGGNRGCESRV